MIDITVINNVGEDVEIDWTYEWKDVTTERGTMARLLKEDPDAVNIRISEVIDD